MTILASYRDRSWEATFAFPSVQTMAATAIGDQVMQSEDGGTAVGWQAQKLAFSMSPTDDLFVWGGVGFSFLHTNIKQGTHQTPNQTGNYVLQC